MQSENLGKQTGKHFVGITIYAPSSLVQVMVKETLDIDGLVPKTKPYKIGVGGSMYLYIMPNGSKYWRFSYRFDGKQKTLAVGTYPEISQHEAENKRDSAKELLGQGIDPSEEKREKQNERILDAQKPKPASKPTSGGFRLSMFDDETFFIENNGQALFLSRKQAVAVYSFLDSTLEVSA